MYSFEIIAQFSFKQPRKVAESGQYDCTEVLIGWLSLRDDSPHFPNLLPCSRILSDPPETQGGLIWTAHALMVLSIHLSCKWARMLKHSSQASVKEVGIWLWGRKMVISPLSIKISRMIGGDRKGSLFPKQFYWLAADQEKKGWTTALQFFFAMTQMMQTPNECISKGSMKHLLFVEAGMYK